MSSQKKSEKFDCITAFLTVLLMVLNILNIFLGLFNMEKNDYFEISLIDFAQKFYTENTVHLTTTISNFTIIYGFNTATIGFLILYVFCSPSENGSTKLSPNLIPKIFLILFNAVFIFGLVWFALYHKEYLVICCAMQILASICLWAAVGISMRTINEHLSELKKGSKWKLKLFRNLLHNGFCLYGTWAFVTGMTGFACALIYKNSYGQTKAELSEIVSIEDGSTIGIVALLLGELLLFIFECSVLKQYFRHVYSIHLVFLTSFAGIAGNLGMDMQKRNVLLATFGTALSTSAFMIKLIWTSITHYQDKKYEKKS